MPGSVGVRRLAAIILTALLGSCGSGPASSQQGKGPAGSAMEVAGLECATGPDAAWSGDCSLERQGDLLTIRHADGGFRRFRILSDGHGLEAADGAEAARLQIVDKGRVEIRIGGDRYRLPVQITGAAR